jgi:hypothetical protein
MLCRGVSVAVTADAVVVRCGLGIELITILPL